MVRPLVLASLCLGLLSPPCRAHFHMLLPARPSVAPGETVELLFCYGHPYEHELLAVPGPLSLRAWAPDSEPVDLLGDDGAGAEARTHHRFRYLLSRRGDHVLAARTRAVLHEGRVRQDIIKVVVHARSQRGWERAVGLPLEIVPFTRPYGLRAGWTFRARVQADGAPLAGALVEVERYNDEAPSETLPEDEFITRLERSDAGGMFSCTLDEAGWWVITVEHESPDDAVGPDGERRPLLLRSTLCAYVGEPLRTSARAGRSSGGWTESGVSLCSAGAASRPSEPSRSPRSSRFDEARLRVPSAPSPEPRQGHGPNSAHASSAPCSEPSHRTTP